jgi:hypothetical protein
MMGYGVFVDVDRAGFIPKVRGADEGYPLRGLTG